MKLHKLSILLLQLLLMTGCVATRVSPGHTMSRVGDLTASAVQSQDPQAATTQTIETDTVTRRLSDAAAVSQPGSVTPAASQIETSEHRKITTVIGAAQKNTAQEIGAKLASVRGFQWFGIALALFGLASLFYPPLKLVVASATTSAACVAAGAAIAFLPLLIIGHEILIIALATGGVAVWALAHRHGNISGQLDTLKSNAAKPPPAES